MAHILVIEDHESVREVLLHTLTSVGHTVRTAPDGPSGIASAEEDAPELVILDYRMPGMDGTQVLRGLKRLQPDLPVFFFTVYGDFADNPALAEADGCFVKSADLTPMMETINRTIGPERDGRPR